jgi:hypothetical protein
MSNAILGWILIIGGVVVTLAGCGGGVATMFQEIRHKAEEGQSFGIDLLPTEFVESLTTFLEALLKAPTWLILVFVGFALIAWGGTIV